jgi:hypothetical protein
MTSKIRKARLGILTALGLMATLAWSDAQAYRMIQNTGVGRFSAGAAVSCNASGGFTHWTTSNIPAWYLRTSNQGSGKSSAIQAGLSSWTAVTPATYTLSYGGTTTAGFVTDNRNTVLWATGNGCSGGCLAITALVLQSGQRIVETDVSFNNNYTWNTNGSNYDVQATWTHEVGHALGIHHTQLTSTPRPTMYAAYFGTGGRSLESDDRSALNCAYSRYPPTGLRTGDEMAASGVSEQAISLSSRMRSDGQAVLRYALKGDAEVKLALYDVTGRWVATLAEGHKPAGEHEVAWDGSVSYGRARSGMYFARLTSPVGEARATVLLLD